MSAKENFQPKKPPLFPRRQLLIAGLGTALGLAGIYKSREFGTKLKFEGSQSIPDYTPLINNIKKEFTPITKAPAIFTDYVKQIMPNIGLFQVREHGRVTIEEDGIDLRWYNYVNRKINDSQFPEIFDNLRNFNAVGTKFNVRQINGIATFEVAEYRNNLTSNWFFCDENMFKQIHPVNSSSQAMTFHNSTTSEKITYIILGTRRSYGDLNLYSLDDYYNLLVHVEACQVAYNVQSRVSPLPLLPNSSLFGQELFCNSVARALAWRRKYSYTDYSQIYGNARSQELSGVLEPMVVPENWYSKLAKSFPRVIS